MKMQRFTSVLLACLLLVCNSGFAFNVHFCGESIASVKLGTQPVEDCAEPEFEKECCAKAAKDHQSCCSDQVVDLQDQADVVVKTFSFAFDAPFISTQFDFGSYPIANFTGQEKQRNFRCEPNAPPLFKLYHQLILYA